jgi:1,4-dihydroxy-2-naphthoate octaprenyltransferase
MSVAAVALGGAYGWYEGYSVHWLPWVLCALGAVAAHWGLGTLMGVLDPTAVPGGGVPARGPAWVPVLGGTVLAFFLGLWAAVLSDPLVFLAGAVASVAVVGLVAPPLPLAYLGHGVGEIVIFAISGPAPVVAAHASQGGRLHPGVLLASVPAGLFGLAIVLSAQTLSSEGDRSRGRLTLASIAGARRAGLLSASAYALAYVGIALNVLLGEYPRPALAGLAIAPVMAFALARRRGRVSSEEIVRETRLTSFLAILTIAWVVGALAIDRI